MTETITSTEMSIKDYSLNERRKLRSMVNEITNKKVLGKICGIIIRNKEKYNVDENGFVFELTDMGNVTLSEIDRIVSRYIERQNNKSGLSVE